VRNPFTRMTAWRFRRWQAYLARHASRRDEGSEHYYNKIYNYNCEKVGRVRNVLSELVGEKTATRILLLDSWQTRLPWRVCYGTWLVVTVNTSAWSSLTGGAIATFSLVPLVMLGNFTGERAARRVLGCTLPYYDDPLSVMMTLNHAGRYVVRRRARKLPAKVLATPGSRYIKNVLEELDSNELETVEKLAPEFDGTVDELLAAAKLLS